jgi:hypothetical protein
MIILDGLVYATFTDKVYSAGCGRGFRRGVESC